MLSACENEHFTRAEILKSFADSNGFRIIYDLQFCYFDENWYNFIQRYVFIFREELCIYVSTLDSWRDASLFKLYPKPQGYIASEIRRSKYQSRRIERRWPEGSFATRMNLYEFAQDFTDKWIYWNYNL